MHDLCKEHRKYWSSFADMIDRPTLTSTFSWIGFFYDIDLLTKEPSNCDTFFEQMQSVSKVRFLLFFAVLRIDK